MKGIARLFLSCIILLFSVVIYAQKINVSGKVTGKTAKMVKEIQFMNDGGIMKSLTLNKEDQTFAGEFKLLEPQFVEIRSGNTKSQFFYLIPNEKLSISIDKPSLPESITVITNSKINKLNEIFDSYFAALNKKGIDTKIRDWPLFLQDNIEPVAYAEAMLKEQLTKNASVVAAIPNFKTDLFLFMKAFRNYTVIDKMSISEIETALQDMKKAKLKSTALNIPFFREYLTDLTNAFAARTLKKYSLNIDYIKQKNVNQFIAAEAITKYISDSTIKSFLFSEKLRIELPTNGLKNEAFVNYLLNNSTQYVKDLYKEKIELLTANKTPDLNAARKKAFNFLLHDSTGKEYRLDDFKGKMLFIDFWASWCIPCKAQIPYQKELEKAYAGKDILFISVSLDKSKPAWLKAVIDEDLHGYVLHAEGDFKNEFPRAYAIESIPRYMLIDVNGNIISDNMMKPQNKKEIRAIFDEELYAKSTGDILEKHFLAIGAETLKKNGLQIDYRQSILSFNSNSKLLYSFPDKMKTTAQFESSEQMVMMLGAEFFNERYTIMNGTKISTNIPGQSNIRNDWVNKVFGFGLFLRKTVNNSVVKFAEETTTGTDSSVVLKLQHNDITEKYYINKKTFLLDKIVIISNVDPRKGGGFTESFIQYEDYRNVNGVMLPFKVNQANITNIKIEKAEVKPIATTVFDN